ncbi:L-carnitine dehydratase/bile acid-inducible protein F [Parafrankia sp. EAN1pec]|uniref:CaiB/BaiF CoA transferase family protein n=1 Tax=Parafrankia sp. (strain EAN1pec) TaxID=298653 RepID=UPI000054218C|nr:L-carnitine dehydratase/bile acid-inducible protein F [Frankia sp. EAN1pec]
MTAGRSNGSEAPYGPLAGVTVLDLTSYVSGPLCTMILGDLGAMVIKVEESGKGDGIRAWSAEAGPDNGYFLAVNRNKLSVALDLKTEEGRAVLTRLVARSDVFIHNMLARSEEALRISEEDIRAIKPDIVYSVIAGYPRGSTEPAFDFIMQAATGLMGLMGEPDGPPVKVPFPIFDVTAAYNACIGIVAVLCGQRERRTAPEGHRVDVNMYDAALASMPNLLGNYLVDGTVPHRTAGSIHANIAPYELFMTDEGWLALGGGTPGQWTSLCSVLGLESLLADDRFKDNASRVRNRGALHELIEGVLATAPMDTWINALKARRVPVTKVNNLDDVLAATDMVQPVDHPTRGRVHLPTSAIVIDRVLPVAGNPPPRLGENTRDVLVAVGGLEHEQVDRLGDAGTVTELPGRAEDLEDARRTG